MLLLALGWILASGIVAVGSGAPAQAAVLAGKESSSSSVQVQLGANRTTGVNAAGSQRSSAHRTKARRPAAEPAGTDPWPEPGLEQGMTEDDLTAGGHTAWWWGGWMLLAVPGGTVLASWVGRPRGAVPPSHGPLYS